MESKEIRNKFLDFFAKRGHEVVPSSSLIPEDSSVLFTTAGMQQFKKYYSGEKYPFKNPDYIGTVSVQKCFRTSDIDEVGDESHLTFFQMLGNFSFGGYFKDQAIKLAYEFITKELGLKIDYVSVFAGDQVVPADIESGQIWKSIDDSIEIRKFGIEDNFWGPTGDEGPCGPTSEIYVNGVEVWNLVFNQYYLKTKTDAEEKSELVKLSVPGVDTGMGLERLAMMVQNKNNIFETDLFVQIMLELDEISDERKKRIISDHARSIVFLISDGIKPSNKEAGYVLRRLIRRTMIYAYGINIKKILSKIVELYGDFYKELNEDLVLEVFEKENEQFSNTLMRGMKEMEKMQNVDSKSAFKLYETYGLPFEIIKERFKDISREDFESEFKKHQELSRTASAGMFKGGLVDTSEKSVRYHTAAHLMLEALRRVLGDHVSQKGSNITSERLRFDFSHDKKMTSEEIKKVEDLVNEKIEENLDVEVKEMTLDEAKSIGATGVFESKYGEKVTVYSIADFSREICGGPHVSKTGEIGKFKIVKEESSSAGIRRIKAVVE